MRRLVKQSSIVAISVFALVVLAGGTAFARTTASYNSQTNQTNGTTNSRTSVRVDENSSSRLSVSEVTENGRTNTDINTNTNTNSRRTLGLELRERARRIADASRAQRQRQSDLRALRNRVQTNYRAVAQAIGQMDPSARSQALQLWRTYIEYYRQYQVASARNDATGRQQAMQDLVDTEADIASLLREANSPRG